MFNCRVTETGLENIVTTTTTTTTAAAAAVASSSSTATTITVTNSCAHAKHACLFGLGYTSSGFFQQCVVRKVENCDLILQLFDCPAATTEDTGQTGKKRKTEAKKDARKEKTERKKRRKKTGETRTVKSRYNHRKDHSTGAL